MTPGFKIWLEEASNYEKIKNSLANDPDWYAIKLTTVGIKLGLNRSQILKAIENNDINHFMHDDVEYLGLPERKVAYDADTKRGINPFEPTYKGDANRAIALGGRGRFDLSER